MAIKFKSKKKFELVNRCIMCGKIISSEAICGSCSSKRIAALKRRNSAIRRPITRRNR